MGCRIHLLHLCREKILPNESPGYDTKEADGKAPVMVVLWGIRDELIRDVLLWIPTHGRAKAGRPARTYIQQLCEDTGCCPEDLPRAMNDRDEWRERVRDIRATSAR